MHMGASGKKERAKTMSSTLSFKPLTPDLWEDLVDLFGPDRGANSGCWCMWWRLPRAEWNKKDRSGRKRAFKKLVMQGPPPGVLAFDGALAVGWCAIGPRDTLPALQRSRVAKAADPSDEAWFINCFYIRSGYRKAGLMRPLAAAAIELARARGAAIVEACPIDTQRELQWGEGFVGLASVFQSLGFCEVARRTPQRPLLRLVLASAHA